MVSSDIIVEKYKRFAEFLGIDDFKGSGEWVSSYKQKHNTIYMVGSAYPVQSKLQGMISLEDVYNCDETGLLCEFELSKTPPTGLISCVKSKKRSGRELQEVR
nr:931_t:CDS:2 [Entrophospora candida]